MPEKNREEVVAYIEKTKKRSDLERISEGKDKTGAFTGLYCQNSISGARLPIYAADFVLATVGTGMVVGVPAHDKRDFEFSQKFNIPVIRVIEGPMVTEVKSLMWRCIRRRRNCLRFGLYEWS